MLPSENRSSHTFRDGSTVSGEAEHVQRAINIERDMWAKERAWVDQLKADGIKASHPDDGWVDREKNRVVFCYPHFKRHDLAVGDRIALGWYDRWRIVRITETEEGGPIVRPFHPGPYYWYFEECGS